MRNENDYECSDLSTIDQLRSFLDGSQAIASEVAGDKDARYQWIEDTLIKFKYRTLGKRDKGVLIQYLIKISGYSRP